ncbi:Predicted arabinose efflux permease, MFS family [Chelatococcus sambhunathii]|uniref:Predicted arabinose efflux permease, MFS family n=1 Tax=Chelatococcus sambhunathii TaxID=363953 RepID=A0ABP2A849_9HYPH|nr:MULTISPECIES: AmpG family muropeptide MFS transporter [Chelatococcus]CUA90537.1 Predicted arabinose efflux permease, MFS family [Chelatococcus sambhunathii]
MTKTERPRLSLAALLSDGRLAIMLALGFSAGLPFLLVFSTLSAWLREAGISRTDIGLLSYVALAYSFKFVWAPVIDRLDVPVLSGLVGRRRAWMLTAQGGIALGLVGIALSDPGTSLGVTVVCALVVAFFSATQDVVIDGWRIDAAPTERQGMMSAAYQLGYRLALICAGAGALYIADFVDWRSAYLAMAAVMAVGVGASLLAPNLDIGRERAAPRGTSLLARAQEMVVEPFADLARRKGPLIVAILALVALFRLPDFVAGVMANPLYIDLSFSKSEIASVSKLYGVWIGILGAFAGGIAATRLGLWTTLLIGAVSAAASNLMFAWLALEGHNLNLLMLSISLDNFAGGFAGTALIAYMSSLTSPAFAATQYALLSSLYALPGKVVGGLSGYMVDSFGYPTFFILTAAIGIPTTLLCIALRGSMAEKKEDEEATAVPAGAPAPTPAARG